MKDSCQIPVRFIATTPTGDLPLNADRAKKRVPPEPHSEAGEDGLRYGPYLEAVRHLLLRRNCRRILAALSQRLGRPVSVEEIDFIEIRTEKHGASYHVARADLRVSGSVLSFAVNVAVSAAARGELERDFLLLHRLGHRYSYPFLPQVYFRGAGRYREVGKRSRWLHMYVAEWLSDFHEFHLHLDQKENCCRLRLWDSDRGYRYLSPAQCLELYRQVARILTAHYNWNTFRQIYPWHHAAGDFVLREEGGKVDVRLITIRDYRPVVDFSSRKRAGKLLALILFFLHLTVQMRLDRLDGIGDVIWAEEHCLEGAVAGFFEGLALGDSRARKAIASGGEMLDLLRSFDRKEWLHLMEECVETYELSQEELSLLQECASGHLDELQRVLTSIAC